jgi:hypothetical protein
VPSTFSENLRSLTIVYGDTDEERDGIACEEQAIVVMTHKMVLSYSSIAVVSIRETEVDCNRAAVALML